MNARAFYQQQADARAERSEQSLAEFHGMCAGHDPTWPYRNPTPAFRASFEMGFAKGREQAHEDAIAEDARHAKMVRISESDFDQAMATLSQRRAS